MGALALTGLGSLPGTDMAAALRTTLGELADLGYLPELPARGVGADMVGRTGALLTGLGLDLQPGGWRLAAASGPEQRRALAFWRNDLDDLEEAAQGYDGSITLSVAGPLTLWACLARPRLDLVLADHGARREVAQSLATGLAELVGELGHRLPGVPLLVKLDEPMARTVLDGALPTSSGFSRHRSVKLEEAAESVRGVLDAATAAGATGTVLHSCAAYPFELADRSGVATLSLDLAQLGGSGPDLVGQALEAGTRLWLGVLPTDEPDEVAPENRMLQATWALVERWGLDAEQLTDALVLTPACGLAGWSASGVSRTFVALRNVAEALGERLGS